MSFFGSPNNMLVLRRLHHYVAILTAVGWAALSHSGGFVCVRAGSHLCSLLTPPPLCWPPSGGKTLRQGIVASTAHFFKNRKTINNFYLLLCSSVLPPSVVQAAVFSTSPRRCVCPSEPQRADDLKTIRPSRLVIQHSYGLINSACADVRLLSVVRRMTAARSASVLSVSL